MTAIASGLNLNRLNDLIDNHVDSCTPQASAQESSTEEASFEVAFAQGRLVELDAAMEIEPEIENNLCRIYRCVPGLRTNNLIIAHLNLSSEWDFDGEFNWATANPLSPGMIIGRTPSFSASSTPRPQFAEQRLSPFSQFINLEIFDTRPGFQLMTNLPWFRLQSMLEQPGVITPRFFSLFPDTNRTLRIHGPSGISYARRSPIDGNNQF